MSLNEMGNANKRAYTVIRPFVAMTASGEKELPARTVLNLAPAKAAGLLQDGYIVEGLSIDKLLIEWRTGSGRMIYFSGTPAAAPMVPLGRAFFLPEELATMRGIDRRSVELIIDIKELFPGCTVDRTDTRYEGA